MLKINTALIRLTLDTYQGKKTIRTRNILISKELHPHPVEYT